MAMRISLDDAIEDADGAVGKIEPAPGACALTAVQHLKLIYLSAQYLRARTKLSGARRDDDLIDTELESIARYAACAQSHSEPCGAVAPLLDQRCTLPRGHAGDHQVIETKLVCGWA